MAIGQNAEVPDALKPGGQRVDEEAANKLIGGQRHGAGLVLVLAAVVLPLESDLAVVGREQALVGDGHSVGVAAQIFDYLRGSAKGRLGVDHPVLLSQGSQVRGKPCSVPQRLDLAEKGKLAVDERLVERFEQQAPEQARQDAYGKKEARPASDPACLVRTQAAAGNHAVQVRMMPQVLAPGVQNREETNLGAQMPGIARKRVRFLVSCPVLSKNAGQLESGPRNAISWTWPRSSRAAGRAGRAD